MTPPESSGGWAARDSRAPVLAVWEPKGTNMTSTPPFPSPLSPLPPEWGRAAEDPIVLFRHCPEPRFGPAARHATRGSMVLSGLRGGSSDQSHGFRLESIEQITFWRLLLGVAESPEPWISNGKL